MRILLIHNYYRKTSVGGEDIAFNLEKSALKEHLGTDRVFEYTDNSDRITILNVLFNVFFSFKHFFSIYRVVKSEKINLVHCHNYFPLLSFSVFAAAKLAGAKTVLTLHNYRLWCPSGILYRNNHICHDCLKYKFPLPAIYHACYRKSRIQSILAAVALFGYRGLMSQVDKVITLTSFQRNFLTSQKLVPDQKVVIKPNFVAPIDHQAVPFKLKNHDIVFVGRLEEAKGINQLIDLITRIDSSCRWLIIGNGPMTAKLEAKIDCKNVTFIHRVDHDKIHHYIRSSKFLIQLSQWYETFGLTIVEAMACGVPVIGLPLGTRLELIVDDFNGYFLQDDGVEVINKVLNISESRYQQLIKNCLNSVSKYSTENVLRAQVELYENMLEGDEG